MKIENRDKYNAQVIIRPSSGRVFKLRNARIWFVNASVHPDSRLEEIQGILEEVPATSIPRTRSAVEREVEITNRVLESLGEEGRVTAETLEGWKADVRAERERVEAEQTAGATEPAETGREGLKA